MFSRKMIPFTPLPDVNEITGFQLAVRATLLGLVVAALLMPVALIFYEVMGAKIVDHPPLSACDFSNCPQLSDTREWALLFGEMPSVDATEWNQLFGKTFDAAPSISIGTLVTFSTPTPQTGVCSIPMMGTAAVYTGVQ